MPKFFEVRSITNQCSNEKAAARTETRSKNIPLFLSAQIVTGICPISRKSIKAQVPHEIEKEKARFNMLFLRLYYILHNVNRSSYV